MPRAGLAIGLFSTALIGCQIAFMQALAQAQWSHFAAMIIAVAMLGFGASGTWLAAAGRGLIRNAKQTVPCLFALAAMAMSAALFLAQTEWARFDMIELFMGDGHRSKLIVTYLVFFLPFFLGALGIGTAFAATPHRIGPLYASNLIGSALGGPLALVLLSQLPAARTASLLALLAFAASLVSGSLTQLRFIRIVSGCICLAALIWPPDITPSSYKDLSRTLHLPAIETSGPFPSALGEVRTVRSPALRYAPGLSLQYQGAVPSVESVFVNGDGYGVLLPVTDADAASVLEATTRALPYALQAPDKVLVLGAGAGVDAFFAAQQGSKQVIAVEPHQRVVELVQTHSGDNAPAVTWIQTTPRAFLSGHRTSQPADGYNLIQLPTIGEFGGDSGLRGIQEDYMFTAEALQAAWNLLAPQGLMAVTVWIDYPPRHTLRTAILLKDLLHHAGVTDPGQHLLAARGWGTLTFLVSRQSLDDAALQAAEAFCRKYGFDLIGQSTPTDREPQVSVHSMEDETLDQALEAIFTGHYQNLIWDYPFDISPPRDHKPYFQHFLKLPEWRTYRELFLDESAPFLEIGLPLALLTFVQIAAISLPLIALPLLRRRIQASGFGRPFVYFICVGSGFMLWEIVLIQRYTLYWGHPLYAAAGVISTLLVAMGLGSYLSSGIRNPRLGAAKVTALLAIMLAGYTWLIPTLIDLTIGLPGWARGLLGALVLFPPAILMGMPFPLGLRWVEDPERIRIAWAWGLDGYASVVSASGAVLLSVLFGFHVPILIAFAAYALAAVAAYSKA